MSATSITADKISDSGKDDVLKFTKFYYHFPVPFVIYADFECFLEKSDADHSVMHVPSGFCALMVSIFEEHDYKLHCYSGKNVMDEFYNYMNQEEQRIRTILNQNNAMIELTEDQNIHHEMRKIIQYNQSQKETSVSCYWQIYRAGVSVMQSTVEMSNMEQ